jgi:hypothetical protein
MLSSTILLASWLATALAALPGPISIDRPTPPGGSIANTAPPLQSVLGETKKAIPTDSWWSGIVAQPGTSYVL